MSESFPIDNMGSKVLETISDTKNPLLEVKTVGTVLQPVIQSKTPEQTLNDTVSGYVTEALKWFQLPDTTENVQRIYTHLAKLINSLKEI